MSDEPPDLLRPGHVIRETWKVVKKLGAGGFGAVFEVQERTTDGRAAIKVEPAGEKHQVLKMEVSILRKLQQAGAKHRCDFLGCGRNDSFNYMIMSLAGTSLKGLRDARKDRKFTLSTGLRLGHQSLEAVHELHELGFLHRDIKPANFAMGRGEQSRTVLMLDFGLARLYTAKDGTSVRTARPNAGFRGTVKYASITTHKGQEMGRVDDLWSVTYMLAEMLCGGLPWRHLTDRNGVLKAKENTRPDELFKGVQCRQDMVVLMRYLDSLRYSDAPDYDLVFAQVQKAMRKGDVQDSDPFDWEAPATA